MHNRSVIYYTSIYSFQYFFSPPLKTTGTTSYISLIHTTSSSTFTLFSSLTSKLSAQRFKPPDPASPLSFTGDSCFSKLFSAFFTTSSPAGATSGVDCSTDFSKVSSTTMMQVMLSQPVPSPAVLGARQWSNNCSRNRYRNC